ncbi:NIM1 [Lepeophtheirus salmonis]|uniref:non-specific serine/threonine protein kinase n=1 Tax=Lepeophtheirus salmonis TaxID=72036 RepID=A0A7R8CW24_LEPSM|nr:NIM1 [Lepeophtheirus salmonis]CAF2899400.1 NIM1 [Lepeophtheirus salmonis]
MFSSPQGKRPVSRTESSLGPTKSRNNLGGTASRILLYGTRSGSNPKILAAEVEMLEVLSLNSKRSCIKMTKDNLFSQNGVHSSPHISSSRHLSSSGSSSRNRSSSTGGKSGCSSRQVSVGSASSTDDSNVGNTLNEPQENRKSIYERLTWQQQHDKACQRDLALGRRIGFYKFKSELGTGNFSRVKMGIHLPTKEKVAIKIIDKRKLDAKTSKMVSKEIAIMDTLSHPHLIRLYEVCETMTNLYLMMEYAPGGELFTRLNSQGPYEEREAKSIFVQVTSAVEYMHDNKFVHRDLKAENVFFSTPDIVKVGDFGFATQVAAQDQQLNTFCGSPPYAAPELFQDDHYYGYSVDIWALGILLYFMLTSTMPFKGQTVTAIKNSILEGSFLVPEFLSYDSNELIKGVLQRQPAYRWTLKKIQESSWLQNMDWIEGDDSFRANPSISIVNNPRDEEQMTLDEGPRSQVLGTYRILLHRFLKGNKVGSIHNQYHQRYGGSLDSSMNSSKSTNLMKKFSPQLLTNGTNNRVKKPPRSRACILL